MQIEQRPDFGYVYVRVNERKHRHLAYAVYFDGLLCGYFQRSHDAGEWLDVLFVAIYGHSDRRRFQIKDNYQAAKNAIGGQNARAKRHGYPGLLCVEDWIDLMCYFGGGCLRCGSTERLPVIDHVVPLSAGGPNLIVNVQPLCLPCNSRKKNSWTDYRDPAMLTRFLLRYKH